MRHTIASNLYRAIVAISLHCFSTSAIAGELRAEFAENANKAIGSLVFFDKSVCDGASYLCDVLQIYCEQDSTINITLYANRQKFRRLLAQIATSGLDMADKKLVILAGPIRRNVEFLSVTLSGEVDTEDRVDDNIFELRIDLSTDQGSQAIRAWLQQHTGLSISLFGVAWTFPYVSENEPHLQRFLATQCFQ